MHQIIPHYVSNINQNIPHYVSNMHQNIPHYVSNMHQNFRIITAICTKYSAKGHIHSVHCNISQVSLTFAEIFLKTIPTYSAKHPQINNTPKNSTKPQFFLSKKLLYRHKREAKEVGIAKGQGLASLCRRERG